MIFASELNIILHAEKLFTIGGFTITNSMLLGWLVSTLMLVAFISAAKRIKITSGGRGVSIIELLCDGVTNLAANVMGSREKAAKYAPFLITLFCFILFNNWFGLLPSVGSLKYHGEPLFRAWTADLTGTLALSISSIIIIQVYTIRELKLKGYFQHYFSNKPWNPINLFIGLLEVLGEFTRVASLALRLFGNIFAGEVLLIVLSSLTGSGSPVATLPFILMEFFVGFIQAFVFTMLVIVYLTLATAHHEDGHEQASGDSPVSNPALEEMIEQGSPSGG